MKRLILLIIVVVLCNSTKGIAQTSSLWGNLSCPLKYFPQRIYYDTIQNKIFMIADDSSSSTVVIANWDGTTWSQMGTASCYNNYSFINYNGEILLANSCGTSIEKWNGTNWIPFLPTIPDGGVNCFLQNGNDLYAGGTFNTVGGVPMRSVAKWDGTTWSGVGIFPYNSTFGFNRINSLVFYLGDLYACGLFPDNAGNVMNIARWDGTNWVDVGGGINGGMDDAVEMAVYNGELYVAGTFTIADGNTGNYIQRWNGTSWDDVGGGVIGDFGGNGQISDIEVYNNALYATGVFTYAGGIPAPQIAKWDGTNWCTLGNEISYATCITKSNTDLYVGWFFKILSAGTGDTTGSVIKWIGGNYVDSCGNIPLGMNESGINNELLSIYPNPSTNQITLEFELTETKNVSIEIKNVLAQTIKTISNNSFTKGNNKIEIDVSEFSNGIYFLQMLNASRLVNAKFIKQ